MLTTAMVYVMAMIMATVITGVKDTSITDTAAIMGTAMVLLTTAITLKNCAKKEEHTVTAHQC